MKRKIVIVNFQDCVDLLLLSFCRKFTFYICCILCVRYPVVPVCKKCAKMCGVQISPLKIEIQGVYFIPHCIMA